MFRKIVEVNGDTLVLPELKNFQGKKVEITLKEFPGRKKNKKNLMEFFGKLKFKEDALEIQKKMRAEWEKREKSF